MTTPTTTMTLLFRRLTSVATLLVPPSRGRTRPSKPAFVMASVLPRRGAPAPKDRRWSPPLRALSRLVADEGKGEPRSRLPSQHVPGVDLLVEAAADVREDVVDLLANNLEDDDDDDGDEDEDEGVLDHALTLLALGDPGLCARDELLQTKVKAAQHVGRPPV